jgi:hypothetical protein
VMLYFVWASQISTADKSRPTSGRGEHVRAGVAAYTILANDAAKQKARPANRAARGDDERGISPL